MQRPVQLSEFLSATRDAIVALSDAGSDSRKLSERIFGALASPARPAEHQEHRERERLSACRHLPVALADARRGPPPLVALAGALASLEPLLSWKRRSGAAAQGNPFYDGHAITAIVGPAGLERRSDVLVGAGVLGPGVQYPFHAHPPEELYIVLTGGEWYSEPAGWLSPGVGGIVYNRSGATHAMRAGADPLLTVWCLRVG